MYKFNSISNNSIDCFILYSTRLIFNDFQCNKATQILTGTNSDLEGIRERHKNRFLPIDVVILAFFVQLEMEILNQASQKEEKGVPCKCFS